MFRNLFRNLVTAPASTSFVRTLARTAGVFVPWDAKIVETSRYSYSKQNADGHRVYLSKPSAQPSGRTDWSLFVTVQRRHSGSAMVTVVAPNGAGMSFLMSAEGLKSFADQCGSAAAFATPRTSSRMDATAWPTVEAQAEAAAPVA
jgi:hypothetical protein